MHGFLTSRRVGNPSRGDWEARFRPDVMKGIGKLEVGRWTYWSPSASFRTWREHDTISIGSFCAIASDVRVIAGGRHNIDAVSGFPFSVMEDPADASEEPLAPGRVEIGSDVWLATGAMVLDGAVIRDGAVVGAGSIVTDEVPPYAVVAGAPARVVRFRFDEATIAELLELQWWEWPDESIRAAVPALRLGDVHALAAFRPR